MQTRPRLSNGFTLLEMMVATTVVVIMLVLFTQIASSTMKVTQFANRQMDISAQARITFDSLSANLNGMLRSGGLTAVVAKNGCGNNDALAFLSDARALNTGTTSRCTLVGFKIGMGPDPAVGISGSNLMLHWGSGAATWSLTSTTDSNLYGVLLASVPSLSGSNAPPPSATISSLGYRPLAPNIFRFEICFLLDNGVIVTKPPRDVNFPLITGSTYAIALSRSASEGQLTPVQDSTDLTQVPGYSNYVPDPNDPTTWRYVRGLVIGLAGMSGEVRQLLSPAQMSNLVNTLPDPVLPAASTPMQAWDFTDSNPQIAPNAATLMSGSSGLKAFPPPVLNHLRLYERTYYVN